MKKVYNKIKCECCGYFTIDSLSAICPVCFWQRDFYQEEHKGDNGGPNSVSLIEAKNNFKNFGVCEEEFKQYVRNPFSSEIGEGSEVDEWMDY
jgi:hypothetical protein